MGYFSRKQVPFFHSNIHIRHPSFIGSLLSTGCGRNSRGYNYPDKRFLEVNQFPICTYIKNLAPALLLMLPLFGMFYLMRSVQPKLQFVLEKG